MTEQPWSELGTALHAHRIEMVRIAGRMAQRSAELAGPVTRERRIQLAEQEAEDARDLAAGVESLTRRADSLLDDTAVMSLDEVADDDERK
jgi:hypothetical protein